MAKLSFQPLTAQRWQDVETLFGARGACAGCWCMWWRMPRSQWEKQKGDGNRSAFRRLVRSSEVPPGILAYADGRPVGWCAIAPRQEYVVLERSRTLKPVDEQPVWSITCFFIARPWRRRGLSVKLLEAALRFARKQGARMVEGYPVEPRTGSLPDAFAWTGTANAFRRAGFKEVARRSATRPIMRKAV